MYKLGIRRSSIILKFYMNGLNDNKQLQHIDQCDPSPKNVNKPCTPWLTY